MWGSNQVRILAVARKGLFSDMVTELKEKQEPNHRVKSYMIDEDYLFEVVN